MDDTTKFLDALFGGKPDRAAVQIWHRSDPALTWFCSDLAQAHDLALRDADKHDVYVACGLAPAALERPARTRLKAHEVCGIPGVWADLDVNGGPDNKTGAAPSIEKALELSSALLEPTVIVGSGYGVQAWWLWDDGPWLFPDRNEQEQAHRLVSGYQGALRAAARRAGWGLDAIADLARVMRLPGTMNHKGAAPVAVTLLEMGGKRYSVDEVGELGQGFALATSEHEESLQSGEGITIEIRQGVALDGRVMDLRDNEPDFDALWNMKKGVGAKRRGWTASEFEFSICNWLVKAGLDAQAICDALVYWRFKIEPGDPRKKVRRERLAQTIGKVMSTVALEDRSSTTERIREEAVRTLEGIAADPGEANEAKTLSAFNRIIGGPEIARLRQDSRDPLLARFSIELANGKEVPLGDFDTIAMQARFRKVYAVVTGHFPVAVGMKKWDAAVAALLKAAYVTDDIEDSSEGHMQMLLQEYMEAAGSADKDGACQAGAPFTEGSLFYVGIAHFMRYLQRVAGESRMSQADVKQTWRMMRMDRKAVNYSRTDGVRTTRSYFYGPLTLIESLENSEAA